MNSTKSRVSRNPDGGARADASFDGLGMITASVTHCVACGQALDATWAFCAACGARRAQPIAEPNGQQAPASPVLEPVMHAPSSDVERLLARAETLGREQRIEEMAAALDEAVEADSSHPVVRLRRAEYFARLGLYAQAKDELKTARRLLPSGDLRAQLYCHELSRWIDDRARLSFVRHPALPRLPSLPRFGFNGGTPP